MAQFRVQRIESLRNKPVYRNVKKFVESELDELNPVVDIENSFDECIL